MLGVCLTVSGGYEEFVKSLTTMTVDRVANQCQINEAQIFYQLIEIARNKFARKAERDTSYRTFKRCAPTFIILFNDPEPELSHPQSQELCLR